MAPTIPVPEISIQNPTVIEMSDKQWETNQEEAIEALLKLGFTKKKVKDMILTASRGDSVETMVTKALRGG